jgi:hypothetical protein
VRGLFGLSGGVCHTEQLVTGPQTDVPSATDVAAMVDAGIHVGTDNFGGKAGWQVTVGPHHADQTHGGFLGVAGRFNTP